VNVLGNVDTVAWLQVGICINQVSVQLTNMHIQYMRWLLTPFEILNTLISTACTLSQLQQFLEKYI